MRHIDLKKGEQYAVTFAPNSRRPSYRRVRLLDTEKTTFYGVAAGWERGARGHNSPAYPVQELNEHTGRKLPEGQGATACLATHIIMPWAEYEQQQRTVRQIEADREARKKRDAKNAKKLAKTIRSQFGIPSDEIEVSERHGTTKITITFYDSDKLAKMVEGY